MVLDTLSTQPLLLREAARHVMAVEHDRIIEETKAKYAQPWWLSSNPYQIFHHQLREQVLLVSFEHLQEVACTVLGRDVFAHEFFKPFKLLDEYKTLKQEKGND